MRATFIYALCEPDTKTIRYIGKTNCLDRRLKSHWRDSRKRKNHLGYWLSSLAASPALLILREVPESEWEEWERRYIRSARALGFDLVNGTAGGEGVTAGKILSAEHVEKIRAHVTGRIFSTEHRARISASLTGRIFSTEHRAKIRASRLGSKASEETRSLFKSQRAGEKNPSYIHRNTSGFVGVFWCKTRKKWTARALGRYVGRFSTIEDAVFARTLTIDKVSELG